MASRTAIHSDLISRCVRSEAYARATQTGVRRRSLRDYTLFLGRR